MSLYFARTASQSRPEGTFVVLYSWTTFSSNADFSSVQMRFLLYKGVTVTEYMPLILSDSYLSIDILISAECHRPMHSPIFLIFW